MATGTKFTTTPKSNLENNICTSRNFITFHFYQRLRLCKYFIEEKRYLQDDLNLKWDRSEFVGSKGRNIHMDDITVLMQTTTKSRLYTSQVNGHRRRNIFKQENEALNKLHAAEDWSSFHESDKGDSLVILVYFLYMQRISQQLMNEHVYKRAYVPVHFYFEWSEEISKKNLCEEFLLWLAHRFCLTSKE